MAYSTFSSEAPESESTLRIEPRRSLARRLAEWFGRRRRPPEPEPERPRPRVEAARQWRTPTDGDGYDFDVSVALVWTAEPGVSHETLRELSDRHAGTIWENIETAVRTRARAYAPDQAATAEHDLAVEIREIARVWRDSTTDANHVRWRARLRVELHEAVKGLVQGFWTDRLKRDAEHRFSHGQVEELRRLIKDWRLVLADLNLDDPDRPPSRYLAPYIANLAMNPMQAATTIAGLTEDWDRQRAELLDVVRMAISTNSTLNTYEFFTSYDSALSLLLKHIGALPSEPGVPIAVVDGGDDDA